MLKILIVDDDLEVLRTLGDAFTTVLKGFLVLTATTANQGLNLIKEHRPDVIIMDVRLGPVSGMDLLEDYRRHIEGYTPRVIVITAYDDENVRKKAELLRVDAFLLKPFSRKTLIATTFQSIEKYLESQLNRVRFTAQAFRETDQAADEAHKELDKKLFKHFGGSE